MGHRSIDVSGFDPVEVTVRGAPELAFVHIADLIVDTRYQRAIEKRGRANILKIAARFDWAMFSPLMVARREDGKFAIIDGQHRAHAAALVGIEELPAMVSDLTLKQEAAAFSWINGTVTALTANQIFKAALMAFEPWAVQCDAVVSRAGCTLMQYNASAANKRPGQVFCIGMVRRFVEAGQSAELATVLQGIAASGVASDIRYYNGWGLSALVPAVAAAGVTRPEALAAFLNAHDLDDVARRVDRLRELPEHRGKSFQGLFANSVTVMLKGHVAGKLGG